MTTVGSLCTGIAGAELALEMMGMNPILLWYSEIDKDASTLLAHRAPGVPNLGDLRCVDWTRIPRVEVLTAGYPCQTESLAGKRLGADDERWIWPDIARAIGVLRPRIVLAENVAAHLSLGFGRVLCDLAALGFDVEWTTFRASDVGACHQRDRIFWAATDPRCAGEWSKPGVPRGDEAKHAGGGSDAGGVARAGGAVGQHRGVCAGSGCRGGGGGGWGGWVGGEGGDRYGLWRTRAAADFRSRFSRDTCAPAPPPPIPPPHTHTHYLPHRPPAHRHRSQPAHGPGPPPAEPRRPLTALPPPAAAQA